jgi:hypothetical protein
VTEAVLAAARLAAARFVAGNTVGGVDALDRLTLAVHQLDPADWPEPTADEANVLDHAAAVANLHAAQVYGRAKEEAAAVAELVGAVHQLDVATGAVAPDVAPAHKSKPKPPATKRTGKAPPRAGRRAKAPPASARVQSAPRATQPKGKK